MQALGGLAQLQRPCALGHLHTAARCQLKTHVQSPWRTAGESAAPLTSCAAMWLHKTLLGAASLVKCSIAGF